MIRAVTEGFVHVHHAFLVVARPVFQRPDPRRDDKQPLAELGA